jgi:DNA polymerase-4
LKIRFSDFKTITRSLTLPTPTNLSLELLNAGMELLTQRLPPRHQPVRLLGFGVHKLDGGATQQQLIDQSNRQRHREIDHVSDQIAAKFGGLAIRRGKGLEKGKN